MEQLVQSETVQGRSFEVYRRFTTKGSPSGFEVREGTFSFRFYSYQDSMRFLDLLDFGTCFGKEGFDVEEGSFRIKATGTNMPTPKGIITIVGANG